MPVSLCTSRAGMDVIRKERMLHKVIIGDPSRYLRMTAFACVMILSLCASATEYFVDKNRPDDNGDGKSIATAYRTIQAAVDNAKKGDIITVLPGVYDEGEGKKYTSAAAGNVETTARVVLDKSIWLRSAEGKEKTFIVGSRIANGDETETIHGNSWTIYGNWC